MTRKAMSHVRRRKCGQRRRGLVAIDGGAAIMVSLPGLRSPWFGQGIAEVAARFRVMGSSQVTWPLRTITFSTIFA